jgi:hypothetical protein
MVRGYGRPHVLYAWAGSKSAQCGRSTQFDAVDARRFVHSRRGIAARDITDEFRASISICEWGISVREKRLRAPHPPAPLSNSASLRGGGVGKTLIGRFEVHFFMMRMRYLGMWTILAGLATTLLSAGCSEPTPQPTPLPPPPKFTLPPGCTTLGPCSMTGPEDDGNLCTLDTCDECGLSKHLPMPEGASCSPPMMCTVGGVCRNGACIDDVAPDGFPCSEPDPDTCVPIGTCSSGVCLTEPPIFCPKTNEVCLEDQCVTKCAVEPIVLYYLTSRPITRFIAEDLNGDMTLDLIFADAPSDHVMWYDNHGNGIFDLREVYTGSKPSHVIAGHVDGDARRDLVIVSDSGNTLMVLLGQDDEKFTPSVPMPLGFTPTALLSGDLDGDGDTDLLVGSSDGTLVVMRNDGPGVYTSQTSYPYAGILDVADLNADGFPDLILSSPPSNALGTAMNNGDGTFPSLVEYPLDVLTNSVAVRDYDGDGAVDVVVADSKGNRVVLLRNQGDGTLEHAADVPMAMRPLAVAAGDVNADGLADMVVTSDEDRFARVFLGDGQGAFAFHRQVALPKDSNPTMVSIDDWDAEGAQDVVFLTMGGMNGELGQIFWGGCLSVP